MREKALSLPSWSRPVLYIERNDNKKSLRLDPLIGPKAGGLKKKMQSKMSSLGRVYLPKNLVRYVG